MLWWFFKLKKKTGRNLKPFPVNEIYLLLEIWYQTSLTGYSFQVGRFSPLYVSVWCKYRENKTKIERLNIFSVAQATGRSLNSIWSVDKFPSFGRNDATEKWWSVLTDLKRHIGTLNIRQQIYIIIIIARLYYELIAKVTSLCDPPLGQKSSNIECTIQVLYILQWKRCQINRAAFYVIRFYLH